MNNLFSGVCNRKVAIIGAGYVGSSIAYALTIKNLAREIVLIDLSKEKAHGEALDIQHGIPYMGTSWVHVGDYADCAGCDLIIVTVGRNRKKDEDRLDLISDNYKYLKSVTAEIKKHYTRGVILVVTNPVDIMTFLCEKWMELPPGRVFGTGCVLDTSRLVRSIANYASISIEAVKCSIVGEHGDSQFPIWSRLAIAGIPMEEYCRNIKLDWNDDIKEALYNSVRKMGATIIAEKERTHYGIATCVCALADAILNQRPSIAPVTSVLHGEYGISDVALSLPSIIGVNGVETRLEEHWAKEENDRFIASAEKLKNTISVVEKSKQNM